MNAISGLGSLNVVNPAGAARSGAAGALDTGAAGTAGGASGAGQSSGSFLDSLGDALNRLNGQMTAADASMQTFAAGGSADIQTVMLQLQEASLGLQVGLQVRDRLLEAYNAIMRLQV